MLLALFSVNGNIRMDEYNMDGSICWNNICRKIWSKGIWISRFTGIAFAIVGILTIVGIVILYNNGAMNRNTMNMN
jgi:hypothetical protein